MRLLLIFGLLLPSYGINNYRQQRDVNKMQYARYGLGGIQGATYGAAAGLPGALIGGASGIAGTRLRSTVGRPTEDMEARIKARDSTGPPHGKLYWRAFLITLALLGILMTAILTAAGWGSKKQKDLVLENLKKDEADKLKAAKKSVQEGWVPKDPQVLLGQNIHFGRDMRGRGEDVAYGIDADTGAEVNYVKDVFYERYRRADPTYSFDPASGVAVPGLRLP